MKKNLVQVNTYGVLEELLGYKTWNLAVKSVGAALNAIEVLSKRKLYKFLKNSDAKGIKYVVLINGREILAQETPNEKKPETIQNSELCAIVHGLRTIDIVPVLAGADIANDKIFNWAVGGAALPGSQFLPRDTKLILAGIVLIIAGIVVTVVSEGAAAGVGVALILAGIGLLAAGVINMLTKTPEEPEIRARERTSYLFSGPTNTVNEGGPVPLGYGQLIVGSSVISASFEVEHFQADDQNRIPVEE